jgi:hypothetical protein|tara:strand:- start:328 stop:450 length:123 start_codon:yes stop_codon:yes gene_type:complete
VADFKAISARNRMSIAYFGFNQVAILTISWKGFDQKIKIA